MPRIKRLNFNQKVAIKEVSNVYHRDTNFCKIHVNSREVRHHNTNLLQGSPRNRISYGYSIHHRQCVSDWSRLGQLWSLVRNASPCVLRSLETRLNNCGVWCLCHQEAKKIIKYVKISELFLYKQNPKSHVISGKRKDFFSKLKFIKVDFLYSNLFVDFSYE